MVLVSVRLAAGSAQLTPKDGLVHYGKVELSWRGDRSKVRLGKTNRADCNSMLVLHRSLAGNPTTVSTTISEFHEP